MVAQYDCRVPDNRLCRGWLAVALPQLAQRVEHQPQRWLRGGCNLRQGSQSLSGCKTVAIAGVQARGSRTF